MVYSSRGSRFELQRQIEDYAENVRPNLRNDMARVSQRNRDRPGHSLRCGGSPLQERYWGIRNILFQPPPPEVGVDVAVDGEDGE